MQPLPLYIHRWSVDRPCPLRGVGPGAGWHADSVREHPITSQRINDFLIVSIASSSPKPPIQRLRAMTHDGSFRSRAFGVAQNELLELPKMSYYHPRTHVHDNRSGAPHIYRSRCCGTSVSSRSALPLHSPKQQHKERHSHSHMLFGVRCSRTVVKVTVVCETCKELGCWLRPYCSEECSVSWWSREHGPPPLGLSPHTCMHAHVCTTPYKRLLQVSTCDLLGCRANTRISTKQ